MIDTKKLAFSTLQLLQEDPRRYRYFGEYWFLIKRILKKHFTKENLYLLGDYEDPSVIERMPEHKNLQEALRAAIETYQQNATFSMGSAELVDSNGEKFTLYDEDAGV